MSKTIKPPSYRTQLALSRGTNRGLELNWLINEHHTTTLYDSSRHARNGTLTDVVANGRLDLDGSTALATVARIAGLTDFTAWVAWNPDDITSIRSPLMDMGDFIIYQQDDDIVAGKVTDTYSDITATAATVLTVGARHDIFLTRIGNDYTLYVFDANGTLTTATFTNSDTALSALTNLTLGADSRPNFAFPLMTDITNLSTDRALVITASDDLRIGTGSKSLNSDVVAENFNANQGTLELWVTPSWDGDDGLPHVVFNSAASASTNEFLVVKDGGSNLVFYLYDKDGDSHLVFYALSTTWPAGNWHHVICTWDFNADAMAIYTDGALRDNTVSSALSSDSFDAMASTIQIGATTAQARQFNGSLKYHIRNRPITAAEVTALYAAGAGNLDTVVVGPDTVAFDNFTDSVTSMKYWPRQQKIASISTVTLTMSVAADGSLVAGEEVVVYDDDDPANVVYTTVASVSGTTVVVDDSCAAVSGTNKTITRNLFVDGGFESAGVANISVGANQTITKDTSVVKFDGQSLKDIFAAADDNDESTLAAMTLVSGNDYSYRFWLYVSAIDGSSNLFLDIDGSATPIHTRQLDTGTDDMGTSYATGTWLYFEGAFQADQTAITIKLRITGAGAGANTATVYLDQCEVLEQLVVNPGMEGTYDDESGGGGGTVNVAPGWNAENVETDGTDTLDKETTIVHSGSASQKMDIDSFNEGIIAGQLGLVVGEYYTLSSWWYVATSGTGRQWNDATGVDVLTTQNNAWEKLAVTFQATSTTLQIHLKRNNGAGILYVDDVTLTRVDQRAASTATRTRDFADGKVDGMAVWNRGMNAAEIQRKRDFVFEGVK